MNLQIVLKEQMGVRVNRVIGCYAWSPSDMLMDVVTQFWYILVFFFRQNVLHIVTMKESFFNKKKLMIFGMTSGFEWCIKYAEISMSGLTDQVKRLKYFEKFIHSGEINDLQEIDWDLHVTFM